MYFTVLLEFNSQWQVKFLLIKYPAREITLEEEGSPNFLEELRKMNLEFTLKVLRKLIDFYFKYMENATKGVWLQIHMCPPRFPTTKTLCLQNHKAALCTGWGNITVSSSFQSLSKEMILSVPYIRLTLLFSWCVKETTCIYL